MSALGHALGRASQRPITRVAILLSVVLLASVPAQTIQKWRTPDGRLFFGDRPPPGSTKVGEVGKDSRPPEPVLSEQAFTAKATQSRYEIERGLKQQSDRLWEIQRQLDRVEALEPTDDPDYVVSQRSEADLAAFRAKKAETLRELEAAKRRSCAAIVDLWKQFDALNEKIAQRYGGQWPAWWQRTLDCPTCPSRDEAERALG